MIHLLVGHRGVGKTAFLRRIKKYFGERHFKGQFFDLDEEVAKAQGQSIENLFVRVGEGEFRKLEHQQLKIILQSLAAFEGEAFISLGAGYQGKLPSDCNVIWLRRPTDGEGRVFLDRPALDPEQTPFQEYLQRYPDRQQRYSDISDEEFLLSEGFAISNSVEPVLLGLEPSKFTGGITVLSKNLKDQKRWKRFIQKRLSWGFDFFELRSDLLTREQMDWVMEVIPRSQLLFSVRGMDYSSLPEKWYHSEWDWPLEFGECTFGQRPTVLSLHERLLSETVLEAAQRLEAAADPGVHLKFAPLVNSLSELMDGHRWWQQDQEQRSFLPRSDASSSGHGRWGWYRLLQKGKMKLNFLREGDGSSLDQPTLMNWLLAPERTDHFAAILGHPVVHSLTPSEQLPFFTEKEASVFVIDIEEGDLSAESLQLLHELGLRWAAVTSPLKQKMFSLVTVNDDRCKQLGSANTISFVDGQWFGTNTDVDGLEVLLADASGSVVVWGGGGTRSAIKSLLPEAQLYSARAGVALESENEGAEEEAASETAPETVIWAVGRHRNVKAPPAHWQPKTIIDLNYTQDSPGLEYAKKVGANYVSGLAMFKEQAKKQRIFWDQ